MARILLAEDDDQRRAFLGRGLRRAGHAVDAVADGEAALVQAHDADYDLLVADVVMPGMNGRKLAEQAAQLHPGIKVVYMTGYSRNAIVHQGRLDPGVDLIQKPLSQEKLSLMVRKVLDR